MTDITDEAAYYANLAEEDDEDEEEEQQAPEPAAKKQKTTTNDTSSSSTATGAAAKSIANNEAGTSAAGAPNAADGTTTGATTTGSAKSGKPKTPATGPVDSKAPPGEQGGPPPQTGPGGKTEGEKEEKEVTPNDEEKLDLQAPEPDTSHGAHNNWDVRCVVVRQGQLMLELQRREPPLSNDNLIRFSDWLSKQLPKIIESFPYVRKSGCVVDLSDNTIGPQGLDRLLNVLRDHKVPCNTLKAYRNCLDDSIVDTMVEYFYTQPNGNAIQSIHMSHNRITDTGCLRLLEAACKCEHYPRHIGESLHPLWLRLECNAIENPTKCIVKMGEDPKNRVCLMQDGQCSQKHCDHWNVHVQLPHFVNQDAKNEHRAYEHGEYDKNVNNEQLLAHVFAGANAAAGNSEAVTPANNGGAANSRAKSPAPTGADFDPKMKEELVLLAKGIQKGLIEKGQGKAAMVQLIQRAKGISNKNGPQNGMGGSASPSRSMPMPPMPGEFNNQKGGSSGSNWNSGKQQSYGKNDGSGGKYGKAGKGKGGYDNYNSYGKSNGYNSRNSWNNSNSYGSSHPLKGGKSSGSFDKEGSQYGGKSSRSGYDKYGGGNKGGNNSYDQNRWSKNGGGSHWGSSSDRNSGYNNGYNSNYNSYSNHDRNSSYGGSSAPAAPPKKTQVDISFGKNQDLGFEYKMEQIDEIDTAVVTAVTKGSEADTKGLEIGWKISRMNGMDVSMFSAAQITELIKDRKNLSVRFKA
ncbi:unnamed protein product [Amoebophrya sp. A120]|nr:unnamed protein product [Amoebophrya sp. A120]|eukprot:GSA120T00021994001.1